MKDVCTHAFRGERRAKSVGTAEKSARDAISLRIDYSFAVPTGVPTRACTWGHTPDSAWTCRDRDGHEPLCGHPTAKDRGRRPPMLERRAALVRRRWC